MRRQTFENYLNNVVAPDPQYDTESSTRNANNKQALAIADFYLGMCYSNAGQHGKVIEQLGDYYSDHAGQDSLVRASLSLVMTSHLETDNVAEARKALETLEEMFPDHGVTRRASVTFYKKLDVMRGLAESPEAKSNLLREMAERLEVSNGSGKADYAGLWKEGNHWRELGEADKAIKAYQRLYDNFSGGEDEETANKVSKFVVPKLAEMLLAKKEINKASELLTPLIQAEIANPDGPSVSREATTIWAKTLTGWLEGGSDGKPVIEVPGTGGDTALFEHAATKLAIYSAQRDSFSCEWFERKFAVAYTYHKWGQVDSTRSGSAIKQLVAIQTQLNNSNWDDVEEECLKEENAEIKARTTGGSLRSHYRWLESRAK